MKGKRAKDLKNELIEAYKVVLRLEDEYSRLPPEEFSEVDRDVIGAITYAMDPMLKKLVEDIDKYVQAGQSDDGRRGQIGREMEQVAYLLFSGINQWSSIKQLSTSGPQFDLLITGHHAAWRLLCDLFHIEPAKGGIVVEVKGTNKPVDDGDFARLCELMATNLPNTVGLGVFVSIKGASGFPTSGTERQGCLRDARLRQILCYAKRNTPIVVLDWNDVRALANGHNLPLLIEARIRDIEWWADFPTATYDLVEVDLPPHLASLHRARTQ